MANQHIFLLGKTEGPEFLEPMVSKINEICQVIDGTSVLSGGDLYVKKDGILLRCIGKRKKPTAHPQNPKEIFDNTVGPDDAQNVTIDIVLGPGDPPDPVNDPPYDGWKVWEGVREKWAADKKLYTYRKYTLIDLNGDTTKIVYEEKVLVVEGAPCSGS